MNPQLSKLSKSSEEDAGRHFSTQVLIPRVGQVKLAQGHVSFIKDVTGVCGANFGAVTDLRALVVQGRTKILNGRIGSEAQSLAFFQVLEDIANSVILVEKPCYSEFAKVWDQYCSQKFKDKEGALNGYGKGVSYAIYIGNPTNEKNWRSAHTSFPLHTVPCDLCLFLTTIVKPQGQKSESPYGRIDLKSIHDFFSTKLVIKMGESFDIRDPATPETTLTTADLSEEPMSPCDNMVIDEDDLPLSTFVRPTGVQEVPTQEAEHARSKRSRPDRPTHKAVRKPQKKLFVESAVGPDPIVEKAKSAEVLDVVLKHTPGEIEW